jgi:hypothetical protein
MKKIKQLDEFGKVNEAITPEKAKFSFNISTNLKKVSKVQKTLIDIHQLLTEINDEIVALKLSYDNLDTASMSSINNMKSNIDNMMIALKAEKTNGKDTGMIDNSERLQRNLEKLKSGFVKKKGA